ncbi:MAG: radical SAM protein [Pseudomonadota bacterium]
MRRLTHPKPPVGMIRREVAESAMPVMTPADVDAYAPSTPSYAAAAFAHAAERMRAAGQDFPGQALGARFAIGCIALEITQRCNLDCSYCYLTEKAEAYADPPLEEVFRRIDAIRAAYGPNVDVQVTGGDPTLRKRDELIAIVRRVADCGLRPSLFTNGIKATRALLADLAAVGLVDVAFHVDVTQDRRGYHTEEQLNALRADYIDRARGLGINVIFNTTVCPANFRELPLVVDFFRRHAGDVSMASFQLGADTGRGVDRDRPLFITPSTVAGAIQSTVGAPLNFDAAASGHRDCNRYAVALTVGDAVFDLYADGPRVARAIAESRGLQFDRRRKLRSSLRFAAWTLRRPSRALAAIDWGATLAWRIKGALLRSRGRAAKISFFIHNFMGADGLEAERLDACSFMVATADGFAPMCLHNARRDAYLAKTTRLADGRLWSALADGRSSPLPDKHKKGRAAAATADSV